MDNFETGEPLRKTEHDKLAEELTILFSRIIPEELRTASAAIDVVSVASGPFVPEVDAVYRSFPKVGSFRAVDQDIPEGLLGSLNERHGKHPGFTLENNNLVLPETLGDSNYDLAILRNPQVGLHGGELDPAWQKIMNNTMSCVKPNGFLILSGHTREEFKAARDFIQTANAGFQLVRQEDPIEPALTSKAPMKEQSIAVLRKVGRA